MNIVEHLIAGKSIIEDPNNWTQHGLAEDDGGYPIRDIGAICTHGVKFCAVGAMIKAHGHVVWNERSRVFLPAEKFLAELAQAKYGMPLARVNDLHGHEAVMEIFDMAIMLAFDAEMEALDEIEELEHEYATV